VHIGLFVTVVILDDFIEKWRECCVGVVRSRVNSNSGIGVFASGVDGVLEWEAHLVLLVDEVLEQVSGQVLAQHGLGASWKEWEAGEIVGACQMGAHCDISARKFRGALLLISEWSLINNEWLGVGVVFSHTALSAWAALLDVALGLLLGGGAETTILPLHWGASCQVLGNVFSLHLILNHHQAFVRNEFAVGPVASLELGENEHALVAHLEGAGSGHLLEVWGVSFLVWHEIIVEVERKILLRDLVFHDHCIWDSLDDARSNLLEKFQIFGFVMAGVPAMLFAVLTELDNKDNIVAASVAVSIIHLNLNWSVSKKLLYL
jgi:hypothetical protein